MSETGEAYNGKPYVDHNIRLLVEGPHIDLQTRHNCQLEAAETLVDAEKAADMLEALDMVDGLELAAREAVSGDGSA